MNHFISTINQKQNSSTKTIYFSVKPSDNNGKVFIQLLNYTNSPFAQFGGASESGLKIITPEGEIYYGIDYHGDVDGWLQDIVLGAEALKSNLAYIFENKFYIITNKNIFLLSDCIVEDV